MSYLYDSMGPHSLDLVKVQLSWAVDEALLPFKMGVKEQA